MVAHDTRNTCGQARTVENVCVCLLSVFVIGLMALMHASASEASEEPASNTVVSSQATDRTQDDAASHLTFASILFYKARSLMAKDAAASQAVFKQIEQELHTAMQLAAGDSHERRRNLISSQSAYLLGDLYAFVFQNVAQAKQYYQESLKYFPEHQGAQDGLKRLEQAPTKTLKPLTKDHAAR